jgi:hypothetical protein
LTFVLRPKQPDGTIGRPAAIGRSVRRNASWLSRGGRETRVVAVGFDEMGSACGGRRTNRIALRSLYACRFGQMGESEADYNARS